MKKDAYVLVIGEDQINNGDILQVMKAISTIDELEDKGKATAYQSIAITFHGYDDIADEVWELNPVRRWVAKLINKVPHLFYYIENDHYQTRNTLMLCVSDFDSVFQGEQKSPEQYAEEGVAITDIPQYTIHVKVHQKSYKEMCSELRKFAKQKNKRAQVEALILEMNRTYNQEA